MNRLTSRILQRHLLQRSESEISSRAAVAPVIDSPFGSPSRRFMVRSSVLAAQSSVVSAPCSPLKVNRSNFTSSEVADSDPHKDAFAGLDPIQISLMKEKCILVDENDTVTGTASKLDCHLMSNINKGVLHRAFSVFLFNSAGDLLIQQRSDEKITFPSCFTNTCCSHPLATPSELTSDPVQGVKRAAQRRMFAELGIPPEEVPLDSFHYLTRIKYKAASDGHWGEHEVDYILFIQKDIKILQPNPNEIKSVRYLSRKDVDTFVDDLEKSNDKLTPWFRLILATSLKTWWDNLDRIHEFTSHDAIHNLN